MFRKMRRLKQRLPEAEHITGKGQRVLRLRSGGPFLFCAFIFRLPESCCIKNKAQNLEVRSSNSVPFVLYALLPTGFRVAGFRSSRWGVSSYTIS